MPQFDLYYNPICPHARIAYVTSKYVNADFEVKFTEFGVNGTRKPEYLKINPTHTVPTLVEGDFVVFESRAVAKYVASKYDTTGTLYPDDLKIRATIDKILFFDATGSFPAIRKIIHTVRAGKEIDEESANDLKEKISILLILLGENRFIAGTDKPTLADISIGVSLPYIRKYAPNFVNDKLEQWYQRVVEVIPVLKEANDEGLK